MGRYRNRHKELLETISDAVGVTIIIATFFVLLIMFGG